MGDKEIRDELQKLKTNKAAGPDGIFRRGLKEWSEIIFKSIKVFLDCLYKLDKYQMTGNKVI